MKYKSGTMAMVNHTFTSEQLNDKIFYEYNKIRVIEPLITSTMNSVADNLGTEFSGLEYSVKTAPSVEDKLLRAEKKDMSGKFSPKQELSNFKDIIRYTEICNHKDIASVTKDTIEFMKEQGYTLSGIVILTPAGFSSLQLCRNYAKFRKTVIYVMSRLTPDAEVPFFCETALQQKTKEASELTALEELLSKTEYIYVIGIDGRPQMPTKRKRHVLKLLNTGKARIAEKVPFTIQLKYDNIPVLQPVILAADPGRTNIGVAALSPFGDLMFAAVIETRNKEIKKLMADRKAHRQASRRGERKARQRLAKKYGTMIKAGMIMRKLPQYAADKFVTCNVIRNTEARFRNRKRCSDWLTPTVNHLVQTHLNVIKKISRYLPVTDIAIEVNRFAFMQMENPNASGVDFQNGPLRGFDDVKAAIREQQNGKCLMCKNDIEHFHHMVPLSKGGSDTIQNQVGLCPKCHAKVHTDTSFRKKLEDKKSGLLKKYGALSALNQAIPFICKDLLAEYGKEHVHFCTGKETSLIRTSIGYEKTKDNQMHEVDAYCIGLASLELEDIKLQSFVNTYKIKQFRRQDRSIIHHQTERSYYLDEQKIATNRKPRFEQTGNALSDWYKKQVKACDKAKADKMLSTLKVKKSSRSYNSEGRLMPGAVFSYNGQRHVMSGQLTGGRYLRAYGDTKTNYPVSKCNILRSNEGLVFI